MDRRQRPIIALFMLGLMVLAALVGGPSSDSEVAAMRWMAEIRAGWPSVTPLVLVITALGGVHLTVGLTSLISLLLLVRGAFARSLLLGGTVLLERLLVEGMKQWVGRPRPTFEVDWLPQSLAYPSGHAANSMTAFLATALIAVPAGHRRPTVVAALALAVAVGLSRIYLGVHWPSDVIGGWVLGLLAVGIAVTIGERSGALRLEAQHQIVGGHRLPLDEQEAP